MMNYPHPTSIKKRITNIDRGEASTRNASQRHALQLCHMEAKDQQLFN